MGRTKEQPVFAPSLVMRRVVRDVDAAPGAGAAPAIESLRYSLGECPWVPDLEAFEQDGQLVVQVDLPGMKLEDVSLIVTDKRVKVEGDRRRQAASIRMDIHVPERTYGRFSRTVWLPEGMNAAAATSRLEDGVLQITFPRRPSTDSTSAAN